MGSVFISDFKYGMDRRRQKVAGVPGTLWLGKNVVINRGGDVETAKAFVPTFTLPAGQTFGCAAIGSQIYVFGSVSPSAFTVPLPNGVQYIQCVSAISGADAMTGILDAQAADGELYCIAKFASGNIYHFYNGQRVTDWDALAAANGSAGALATYLASVVDADANVSATAAGNIITISANVPGTAFTLSEGVAVQGAAITGTPTGIGPSTFTITATDSASNTGTVTYSLSSQQTQLSLSPTAMSDGVNSTAYSQTIVAAGGTAPYTFYVAAGTLPTGLTLAAATGVISGTPSAAGRFAFTIQAIDSAGLAGTQDYVVNISSGVLVVGPTSLPPALAGTAFSATFAASGGKPPYTYAKSSGSLPTGVSLNTSTGVLSGTPSTSGTFSFVIGATDANSVTGSRAYVWQVNTGPIILTPSSLGPVAQGIAATLQLAAAGNTGNMTFAVSSGSLPAGLTLNYGGTLSLATPQANVSAVAETLATGTVTITGGANLSGINRVKDVLINGISTMLAPADWVLSNAATASAVAAQINNKTATTGYTATAAGPVITISAGPGTGATPNGFIVAPQILGSVTTTSTNMAGGVTAVAAVAQISTAAIGGTYAGGDQYTLTVNGVNYTATGNAAGTGKSLYLYLQRMWSPATSLWEYCALDTFTNWSNSAPSSGAGFINLSNDQLGSEPLVGAGTYISQAAIFSRRNLTIFNISTDATQNSIAQSIDNSGTRSDRSILAYGTTDLFYLDETGIRSLKARDASGEAFVNDLGTAIDAFVVPNMNALPNGVVERACAVVEPLDGRYWLAIGPYIYVLSYFPGSNISAWTYLDPGFSVSDFARAYNQLYARAGDTIYLYGGANGQTYPAPNTVTSEVELPFSSTSPPSQGIFTGFDMSGSGEWQVKVYVNPNNTALYVDVGIVDGTTYQEETSEWPARATHVSPSLICTAGGLATISNITLWHDGAEPTGGVPRPPPGK